VRALRRLVAAGFVVGMLAGAPAASALNNPQDDKNNPTAPGRFQGPAWDSRNEHCAEHYAGTKGGGSDNLPAQCQTTRPR
jgi:hypothetical protein